MILLAICNYHNYISKSDLDAYVQLLRCLRTTAACKVLRYKQSYTYLRLY